VLRAVLLSCAAQCSSMLELLVLSRDPGQLRYLSGCNLFTTHLSIATASPIVSVLRTNAEKRTTLVMKAGCTGRSTKHVAVHDCLAG
jgi:hypothetical protein